MTKVSFTWLQVNSILEDRHFLVRKIERACVVNVHASWIVANVITDWALGNGFPVLNARQIWVVVNVITNWARDGNKGFVVVSL
jgi:hypothetical protein